MEPAFPIVAMVLQIILSYYCCHIIVICVIIVILFVISFVIVVIIVILFVILLLPWSCKSFCHILLVSACHCCLIKGFFGKSMLNINMSNLFILSHYSFFQVVHYFLNPLIDVICENPAKIQLIVLHQLHG